MPADRRKRISRNEQFRKTATALLVPSETVGKRFQNLPNGQQLKPETPGTAQPDGKFGAMTKKQKRGLRRDSLKQRLGITPSPYSKSHRKRIKRKAAEQLSTDLKSIERAIMAVDNESVNTASNLRHGQIGEGKDSPLTAKQRKRTFQAENLRHKAILNTPEFTSNPFQTIRTHAQNTLVKHQ